MDATAGQDRRRAIAAAIATSILLHGAIAAFLLRYLDDTPVFPPAPIMTVELVPWLGERETPPPRPKPPRRAPQPAPPHPLSDVLISPTDAPAPLDANPVPVPPSRLDASVRHALRGLMGCDRLPREEREACQDRMAARRHESSPRLNLDPQARFTETPEAYVNRKPKNGCKLRATGDPGLHGKDGARAAFACSWDF